MKKFIFFIFFLPLTSTSQIKPFIGKFNGLAVYKYTPSLSEYPAGYLEAKDSVKIIDFEEGGYWKVSFDNQIAYMHSSIFVRDSNFIKAEKLAEKELPLRLSRENATRKALLIKENATRKALLIKKYGAVNGLKIFNEKIWLGMTKAMAKDSWGEPEDINRTVGSWGVHEQWVYGSNYLYFENGKLTSWQD